MATQTRQSLNNKLIDTAEKLARIDIEILEDVIKYVRKRKIPLRDLEKYEKKLRGMVAAVSKSRGFFENAS